MSEHSIDGLDGEIVITRDRLGIPKISADGIDDLFVGQGWATAADRLGQMEWDRRRALGRTAELHATPANVVADSFHRRARLADHARAGFHALDDATQAVLAAYARGVNACAEAVAVPAELAAVGAAVEAWEPWTPIAVFLVRHVNFANWQTKLWNARTLAALGPDGLRRLRGERLAATTPVIVPSGVRATVGDLVDRLDPGFDAETLAALAPLGLSMSGSNAWAVAGDRTASGAPIVAGDPHRVFEVPGVYYQLHLSAPGIDATGVSFVGVPGIQHFAQTDAVAWAVTNAMADYQDLFVEHLPDATVDRRQEQVAVRDGSPVEIECATTEHGPVVVGSSDVGVGLALASTGLRQAGGSLRAILPMLRARHVDDLLGALDEWVEPVNNFVLADTSGRIAYRTAGQVPRRHELNRVLPVPGWDPAYRWQGTIGTEELPVLDRPGNGAVVTANQRITTEPIGHELGDGYASPRRAERIWHDLAERTDLTVADHEAIHADDMWAAAPALVARVIAAGGPAATVLAEWDGRLAADSEPAALAMGIVGHLVRRLAAELPAELGANPFAAWEPPATAHSPITALSAVVHALIGSDDEALIGPIRWVDHLPGAIADALADPPAVWGDRHRLTPRFALAGADPTIDELMTVTSPPLGGGRDCVLATIQYDGLGPATVFGSTVRYVWDLADRTASRWVVPLGASGDPASPHFADQMGTWARGETFPVRDDTVTMTDVLRPAST